MPLTLGPMRYAHAEGHTDVCYFTGKRGGFITCGTDGDVRAWLDVMDDDPSQSCVADQATTVISKDDKVIVGHDNNIVQILNYPDLEKEGIVTRFSSLISALATSPKSDLIVSGSGDMRIQVNNWKTSDCWEYVGHEGPILALTLDPKGEFFASSSADGTIKVWHIKDRCSVKTWSNVVPKCNSFLTATSYGAPSFECKHGKYLAYPQGKDVVIFERSSWNEIFRLRSGSLNHELSICKFSECGKMIAASSTHGEVIVWIVESKEVVGYLNHPNNAKITSLAWKPDKSTELAFCDGSGEFGCIKVESNQDKTEDVDDITDEVASKDVLDDDIYNNIDNYDDDDDDNVIDISKIKSSVMEDDRKSVTSAASLDTRRDIKIPEFNLQSPFQPGSSPIHLQSRYMVWNDVGVVTCYKSEDEEDSTIEANFHDVTIHHSLHINNYLHHTMAALSNEALALACPALEGEPSKLVVVALQGWGSGNKEWTVDLPVGEEAVALAAGSCFVALATSTRRLRIFMVGGTQREVLSLPGPVVAMNGFGNNLAIAYHSGLGANDDQNMNLMWIRVCGPHLKSHTSPLPLSPASNLSWLGFTDLGSPVAMDAEGVLNIYDRKSTLWKVGCDTTTLSKGKFDHYFIIGIDESTRSVRCILCKGSHYPPVTPKPVPVEIELNAPLCEPQSEKSEREAKIWQFGSDPIDEKEALLSLIALACRNNTEYRAVDVCEQIGSQKVIELAIRYAARMRNMALANKLESIAETKESDENIKASGTQEDIFSQQNGDDDDMSIILPSSIPCTPDIEIRPLTPSQPFGRRSNPFLKRNSTNTAKGLAGLNSVENSPRTVISTPSPTTFAPQQKSKTKALKTKPAKDESFVNWYLKNKKALQEQYPDLNPPQLAKKALEIHSAETKKNQKDEISVPVESNGTTSPVNEENEVTGKKRKLDDTEENDAPEENTPKRSFANKLAAFVNKT